MRAASAALAAGAWGMSTGLVYPPGAFAETDEIVAVGRLPAADGLYVSHIRNEGDGLGDAVQEAIGIGRQIGIRVEVSHLKAAGRNNHGRATEASAMLDSARRGRARPPDVYPYTAGSTLLNQVLPPWIKDGGRRADARLTRVVPESRPTSRRPAGLAQLISRPAAGTA